MNGSVRPGAASADWDGPGQGAEALATLSAPLRDWFLGAFPAGPTPAQALAWPSIAAGENVLLIAPTGTGKTLAAFLSVIDRLMRENGNAGESKREGAGHDARAPGVRCLYVSPMRSLNYDIERNLEGPLAEIGGRLGLGPRAVRTGVRTGDTSAYERRALRDDPPQLLITTPESLSLLLSHEAWRPHWRDVQLFIIDEIHALAPNKRGADLTVSLERIAACAQSDPQRIGLSATCRPDGPLSRFLVGNSRSCRVIEAPPLSDEGRSGPEIQVETLIQPDEAPHRGLSYRRLLRRLRALIEANRTTIVFANTRAFVEKITRDLNSRDDGAAPADRSSPGPGHDVAVAAHHSALDAQRRRAVESDLRTGALRAVVTSTSLELGVDVGTADLVVQIGPPGGVARCLQRVGRSGHHVRGRSRGTLLAATPGELIVAAVTARAARAGRVEPTRVVDAPLDVVCQQLVGMACAGGQSIASAFETVRNAGPMASLSRDDFDACLAYLAGELAAPAGAAVGPNVKSNSNGNSSGNQDEDDTPRWTAPRIWKHAGRFGVRNQRTVGWFRGNVGTIRDDPPTRVLVDGVPIGTLESAYAERLAHGDRFVLDGRALEVVRCTPAVVHARLVSGEAALPRWTSDRPSWSPELAGAIAAFRDEAARRLASDGPLGLRGWLFEEFGLGPDAAAVVIDLFQAQEQWSAVPSASGLLVEESPAADDGLVLTFHAPLNRAACEALARAVAARLGSGRGRRRDLRVRVADLGWSIHAAELEPLAREDIAALLDLEGLENDVLRGLDHGELPARRFARIASIALMVVRNPGRGPRVRVGGRNWASERLYPLVRAACPDHPLLRQTRRETLEEALDVPAARRWLESRPTIALRSLPGLSPFAAAWIEPADDEALHFEAPADALLRLHQRLMGGPAQEAVS